MERPRGDHGTVALSVERQRRRVKDNLEGWLVVDDVVVENVRAEMFHWSG